MVSTPLAAEVNDSRFVVSPEKKKKKKKINKLKKKKKQQKVIFNY